MMKKRSINLKKSAHEFSRRKFLGSSIGILGATAMGPLAHATGIPATMDIQGSSDLTTIKSKKRSSLTEPTYGDYTVIYNHLEAIPVESGHIHSDAPSLLRTTDDALLCSVPLMIRGNPKEPINTLHFFRSTDNGRSWTKLPGESTFVCGTLFKNGKSIFFIGAGPGHRDRSPGSEGMRIIRSDDQGQTWTDPVMLFKGPFYQPAGGYVKKDGKFYWCCDTGRDMTYVIAGDLNRDLSDPDAWRISEGLPMPEVPKSLTRGTGKGKILEGNVLEVNGRLQVSWRYMIDERDTVGIGVICDLDDNNNQLKYSFRQFYPLPGAQNQFYIIHDEISGLYWMNANLPTHTQDDAFAEKLNGNPHYSGVPGKERRILALFCSFDALNWLPAGYIIVWPLVRQSSNYCGLLIDGDDLLVASRTSRNGRNQHDNDLTAFHRIRNFRDRARHLFPKE